MGDAERATTLAPDWGPGWGALGAALEGVGRLGEAIEAYDKAAERCEDAAAKAKAADKAAELRAMIAAGAPAAP